MNIVIVGHVDHGKSTIIGRLLADTNSLPKDKIEQVKASCERNSKPFEYAFLLDALKDEQAQGITIDVARCFFKTKKRKYLILDAPGHIEFLKNMITGAASAEAALLVIDAKEGIQENSKRHGYMLEMLGIKQLAVLVNKMDLVKYNQEIYKTVVDEYSIFLKQIGLHPTCFIPVSGMQGDNITKLSKKLDWYQQQTVLEILDQFKQSKPLTAKPFRMPIQAVYKFSQNNDDKRIVVGKIESGTLTIGDEVVFYPSAKKSRVKSIEAFNSEKVHKISADFSTGFTLDEQIYIKRGDLAVLAKETKPRVSSRIKVSIFWLGKSPLSLNKTYFLRLGTSKTKMTVEKILYVMNAFSLKKEHSNKYINRHEVAECILQLHMPIAFDLAEEHPTTSRFVIINEYDIAGGGIIREGLKDKFDQIQKKIQSRNYHWITSNIAREERAKYYQQNPKLIIITGKQGSGRKTLARTLEKHLIETGKKVYYLGIGNVIYGIDSDIKNTNHRQHEEHLRRFTEVLNIMLDAGLIMIITAVELTEQEIELIKLQIDCKDIYVVWMGSKNDDKQLPTNFYFDKNQPVDNQFKKIIAGIDFSFDDKK